MDILDQSNKWIEVNKSAHPSGTLATTVQKPTEETNPYAWLGYGP